MGWLPNRGGARAVGWTRTARLVAERAVDPANADTSRDAAAVRAVSAPHRSLRNGLHPAPHRPWAFATLSMLLGLGSVVLALVEPQHQGVPSGFIVSTIGVTAIVCGVQAVRRARWGSVVSRAFGRVGIVLGAVGSALMLYACWRSGWSVWGSSCPRSRSRL